MYKGLLHSHTLLWTIYLLHFFLKLVLMFLSKPMLEKYRTKTKVIGEMIIPTLILVTGFGMLFQSPYLSSPWMWVKILSMFAAAVVGIIGFKKQNAPMAVLSFLLLVYTIMLGYRKDVTLQKNTEETKVEVITNSGDALTQGKEIYKSLNCAMCHGEDGALQLAGAANLQTSTQTDDYIKDIILNGKNSMQPFKDRLNPEQLNALVEYVNSMKK